LLDELVVLILKEWISVFEDGPVGTALVVGHESNTRFLQMASDESPFFVLSADLCIGEISERMQLAAPFPLIDALTNRLTNLSRRPTSEAKSKPLRWRAPFSGISVELSARWSVKDVTLGEILNLSAGDLIELPQDLIDRTEIVVSGTSEFVGTIGVDGGRLAVYLNDRVNKE
jgi:flagellar motor switch protein FliM